MKSMQILEPSPKIAAGIATPSPKAGRIEHHAHVEDPRWQLARRIAASGSLGRSRLLAEFLLYIVDRHVRDRTDEITEQQIGILVFGRAEGYDSNDDNIVRSYARNLRKRIDQYFATEGKEETLRLEIPRGGYAPAFSARILGTPIASENLITPHATPSLVCNDADNSATISRSPDTDANRMRLPLLTEAPTSVAKGRWAAGGR